MPAVTAVAAEKPQRGSKALQKIKAHPLRVIRTLAYAHCPDYNVSRQSRTTPSVSDGLDRTPPTKHAREAQAQKKLGKLITN